MLFSFLAGATVILHALFVLFVVLGGFLVLRWRRLAWLHVPAAIWGVVIELAGWICPLTPLENYFRARAGEAAYRGGFVEHYVMPVLYPVGLTERTQLALAAVVIIVNAVAYGLVLRRKRGPSATLPAPGGNPPRE